MKGLIDDKDVKDFIVGNNFKYKSVPGAGHFDLPLLTAATLREVRRKQRILSFKNLNPLRLFRIWLFRWLTPASKLIPDEDGRRTAILREAITAGWDAIQPDATAPRKTSAASFDHVVFLRHGIRDEGGTWVADLKAKIQTLYPKNVKVDGSSFGSFSMLQFLWRGSRVARVYRFMDQYLDCRIDNWDAQFHFFGHSYGTYIGCKALRDYKSCDFKNVVLGNSVMARDFPWDRIRGTYTRVLNLRGRADFVVAWFPGVFEWWREKFFNLRSQERTEYLGSAGFSGFNADLNAQPAILNGTHGAATREKHHDAIARFLIGGEKWNPRSKFA